MMDVTVWPDTGNRSRGVVGILLVVAGVALHQEGAVAAATD